MKQRLHVVLFILLGFCANAQSNSYVVFKIKNFGITVEGSSSAPNGKIYFEPGNLSSSIFDVTIEVSSVNTGIDLRDSHLKKKEYFDVKNYPHIKFKSTSIERDTKSGNWIVNGDLTMKNVTKTISFPFSFEKSVLFGTFTVNRREFNVGGKSLSMADEVIVELKVKNQKL